MPEKNDTNDRALDYIKEFFITNYTPAEPNQAGAVFMSTRGIYNSLFEIYPHEDFEPAAVTEWLIEGGFKILDMGGFRFEWVLKQNQ